MMFFKKKKSLTSNYEKDTIYAPIDGKVLKLEEINDPVFSQGMMGEGIAIYPSSHLVRSPVNGIVKVVFPTKHAIGIEMDNGCNVILHCGIETVNLKGKYFDSKVIVNQKVGVNDLLLEIDLEKIEKEYDPTVIIVVEKTKDYKIEYLKNQGFIKSGQPVYKLRVDKL